MMGRKAIEERCRSASLKEPDPLIEGWIRTTTTEKCFLRQ